MDIRIDSSGLVEYLEKINSEQRENQGGFVTTRQIREVLNISDKRTLELLRKLKEKGMIEHGHVWITSIDNKRVKSNGYRLKPEA